jgi:hypothetical protein
VNNLLGNNSQCPLELGIKVSMAVTHRSSFVSGVRSFVNNLCDGHTLAGRIELTAILLQDMDVKTQEHRGRTGLARRQSPGAGRRAQQRTRFGVNQGLVRIEASNLRVMHP